MEVGDYISENWDMYQQFLTVVSTHASSDMWENLWGNYSMDVEFTMAEIEFSAEQSVAFMDFGVDVHEMIQDFISYHWESLDLDSSGGLNFTEFKNLMARAALTDALTIMAVYDVDGDGLLDEAEAVIAAATFKSELALWEWEHDELTPDFFENVFDIFGGESLLNDAINTIQCTDFDEDNGITSTFELALLTVSVWNIAIAENISFDCGMIVSIDDGEASGDDDEDDDENDCEDDDEEDDDEEDEDEDFLTFYLQN